MDKRTKMIVGGVVLVVLVAVVIYMNFGGSESIDRAAVDANAQVTAEIAEKTPPQPEQPQYVTPPGLRGAR